ncbi:hypothetical protein ACJX0J_029880, partial [Zea mays]
LAAAAAQPLPDDDDDLIDCALRCQSKAYREYEITMRRYYFHAMSTMNLHVFQAPIIMADAGVFIPEISIAFWDILIEQKRKIFVQRTSEFLSGVQV